MTPRQTLFVALVALCLVVLIVELIRRGLLRERYAAAWFLIAVGLLSVPVGWSLYAAAARFVGIVEPTSFFFYTAIMLLLLLCLQFSLGLSMAFRQRQSLAQDLALLEQRVRELERRLPGGGTSAP